MTTYYDKTKDMICIHELYSDTCEINNDANTFFIAIRTLLRTLGIEDKESTLVTYMCEHKLIYPGEFLRISDLQDINIAKDVIDLGFDENIAHKIIKELTNIALSSIKLKQFVDSDPRTNGSIKAK